MEKTIGTFCKKNIPVIAGHTLFHSTATLAYCIIDQFRFAQRAGFHVKRCTIQIILQLPVMVECLVHTVVQRFELVTSRTEVQPFAVRTPRGKEFQLDTIGQNSLHGILLHIVEYNIAGRLHHLDLSNITRMKRLHGAVCTESYQRKCWMPVRINGNRNHLGCFQADILKLAVMDYHSSIVTDADMKHHIICPIVLIAMAINTGTFFLCTNLTGVEDIVLAEILQTTLPDGQMFKTNIRWRQGAIRDIGVDTVGSHFDRKWFIPAPLIILFTIDIYCHLTILSRSQKFLPFLLGNDNLVTLTIIIGDVSCLNAGHDLICLLNEKIERCNINRDRHIGIVWIDIWFLALLCIILW